MGELEIRRTIGYSWNLKHFIPEMYVVEYQTSPSTTDTERKMKGKRYFCSKNYTTVGQYIARCRQSAHTARGATSIIRSGRRQIRIRLPDKDGFRTDCKQRSVLHWNEICCVVMLQVYCTWTTAGDEFNFTSFQIHTILAVVLRR